MKGRDKLWAVVDTNVLLVSISSRSRHHWLYKAIIDQKFYMPINQEILLEYEETISIHWNPKIAKDVVRSLNELPNVVFTPVYFHLSLISSDEDDNKFVDCAFAANANYIVTHDHHFDILETVSFPQIQVVNTKVFKKIIFNKQQESLK